MFPDTMSLENRRLHFAPAPRRLLARIIGVPLCVVVFFALVGCRPASPSRPRAEAADGEPAQLARPTPPRAAARAVSSGYLFTPAETAAVDDFLRRHPNLRVATDADRRPGTDGDADLKSLYGIYHAYFVRGDVNDDGVLDFVLAFVRRDLGRGTPWFSIVAFTGRPGAGGAAEFSSGTFLERDVTLARGDLSVDRDSVVITPDLDSETVRRYRWDPATHVFVFVRGDSEESEAPSVSQTGNRILGRARTARG